MKIVRLSVLTWVGLAVFVLHLFTKYYLHEHTLAWVILGLSVALLIAGLVVELKRKQ